MKTGLSTALLLVSLAALSACGDRDASTAGGRPASQASAPADTAVARSVRKAIDKARTKLAEENITLGDVHVTSGKGGFSIRADDGSDRGRPKAEITPRGDLLIEGREIEATPEQHALLLDYRRHIERVAGAGMDIGAAGAELGIKAAGEALRGVFSGDTDKIEERIEAQTDAIKASVVTLCGQLPAMLETQNKLAESMPEFRPYATMDQSDIDDCAKDSDRTPGEARAMVRDEVRQSIRDGIRGAVRGSVRAAGVAREDDSNDAAAEADAEAATAKDPAAR